MPVPHMISDKSISVMVDQRFRTLPRSHPNAEALINAITDGAGEDVIRDLVSVSRFVSLATFGALSLVQDPETGQMTVHHHGVTVRMTIAQRIIDAFQTGAPYEHLLAFLANIKLNPRTDVAEEIYDWVENSELPITDDGCLLAVKLVRGDYRSFHDSTFMNEVGTWVEEKDVDNNRYNTCSRGLHFCSPGYLPEFASMNGTGRSSGEVDNRVLILKVNPRDVAAIPTDYSFQKGRASGYWIVGEMDPSEVDSIFRDVSVITVPNPEPESRYEGFDHRDYLNVEEEDEDEEDYYTPEDYAEYDDEEEIADAVLTPKTATDYIVETGQKTGQHDPFAPKTIVTRDGHVRTFTRDQILGELTNHGSQRAVSRATGIPRSTLQGWMKAWSIPS